ncbi:MAG TPA: RNA polymerase sigma factor, partial [Saprospiraceae bacterium]|nr:RNA polymerase sigma factor [Saprospiraceae bacterium]
MKVSYSQKELVKACIKGERKAMKSLYEIHGAYLFGVCRRYMPTEAEAEEMLSDAFLRIFEKLDSLRDYSKLRGWMKTLAVRMCLDELRKTKKIQLSWNEEALEEAANEY